MLKKQPRRQATRITRSRALGSTGTNAIRTVTRQGRTTHAPKARRYGLENVYRAYFVRFRHRAGSARNLLRGRNIGAELHRRRRNFPTAGPQGNRSDHGSNNDSALHIFSPVSSPIAESAGDLTRRRNFRAQFHRRCRYLPTAGAQRHRRDDGRNNDYALHSLHGLLSSRYSATANNWVPTRPNQIKDRGPLVALFPPCWCGFATESMSWHPAH